MTAWCVVGNIVAEGTKHFVPGAKVYCWPPMWGDGYERVRVVGYRRGSHGRRLVTVVMPLKKIENLRVKEVYDQRIINKLPGLWSEKMAKKMVQSIGR